MDVKKRFLNALQFKPVDRPPVAAVVTGITVPMMEKVGIYTKEWEDICFCVYVLVILL